MKNYVSSAAIVVAVGVLAMLVWTANSAIGSTAESRSEFGVTFKQLRAYDQASNTFTGTSYLVKTHNGPGCSAVLSADQLAVSRIQSLEFEDGRWIWTGPRAEFPATGLPNPCP